MASLALMMENGGGFFKFVASEEALGLKYLFRVNGPKLIVLVDLQGGARM